MKVVLPIFLLFYSPASPRPQLSQVRRVLVPCEHISNTVTLFTSLEGAFSLLTKKLRNSSSDPQVSGNSLEDEDSLAATPFLLASGLAYRDMLTISAARLVAQFGLNHNRTQPRTFKPIFRWGTAGTAGSLSSVKLLVL